MSGEAFEDAEVDEADDERDAPEHDNALLAGLLGIEERALIAEIGGPWSRLHVRDSEASEVPEREYLFIGRTGASAFLAFNAQPAEILVGQAAGTWHGPGTLNWSWQEPRASVPTGDGWLEGLSEAIDAAYTAKQDSLFNCKYCGDVFGPEAGGPECCSGCASTYFGIVY